MEDRDARSEMELRDELGKKLERLERTIQRTRSVLPYVSPRNGLVHFSEQIDEMNLPELLRVRRNRADVLEQIRAVERAVGHFETMLRELQTRSRQNARKAV